MAVRLPRGATLLLAFLCLLCLSHRVHSDLVAYYNFDADGTPPLTGSCGFSPPAGKLSNARLITTDCRSGSCLNVTKTTGHYNAGKVSFFPNGGFSYLTVSAWVHTPKGEEAPVGLILAKSNLISMSYTNDSEGTYVACYMVFGNGGTRTSKYRVTLKPDTGYSITCRFNGSRNCVYVNTASSCSSSTSVGFLDPPTNLVIGGDGESRFWPGTIDEVKIYDHSVPYNDIVSISRSVAANDQPSVSILLAGVAVESASLPVYSEQFLSANISDARQAFSGQLQPSNYESDMIYRWFSFSSTCGATELSSTSTPTIQFSFTTLSSSTIALCVSDGELANQATIQISSTPSMPTLIRQPTLPVISIPEGAVFYPIVVEGSSLPAPSYQWELLTTVFVNSTDNDTTTEPEVSLRHLYEQDHHYVYSERDLVPTLEWQPIVGATSSALLLNGSLALDGATIRCVIYNGGGRITTNNFTITINSAPSSSAVPSLSPGVGGGSDTGLIAGLVVGIGGGLILLCTILAVIGLLVALRYRRGRSAYRKLTQPDWEQVIFGDVKDDTAIPKKQLDEYNRLEQLLAGPDHRLALAITATANISERDQVYRSLLRVLSGQHQAYNLIARIISLEVADADDEGTLFRANSAAAKLFTFYMRMVALRYLWHVLVLSVHALNDNARDSNKPGTGSSSTRMFGKDYRMEMSDDEDEENSGGVAMDILGVSSMELDPQKLDDASDLEINTLELWLIAQKMFKLVMQSETAVPRELRMLIRRIHDEVAVKFSEEAVFRAMGGFFFLRLICPALLAPQLHGLLDEPPHPTTHRQLILVTKVLQNLANDTLPGTKEAYMERLNTFISSNKASLERFYHELISHPEHGKYSELPIPQRVRNESLVKVRKFLDANWRAIEASLRNDGGEDELIEELRHILHKEE